MSLLNITTNGAIRTVTLNRPEKRNALNPEMMAELIEAFSATPPADERVTVIRAEGPAFCAGLQLSSDGLQEGAEEMVVTMFDTVQRYPLPVVAVVQGPAIAGGCELALHCDFIVALEHAPFAMPVAQIGVTTDWFLTKKIMESAGLPMARGRLAKSADDAAQAAMEVGYPVVLKIASTDIQRKTEIGGVKLNLQSVDQVRAGYQAIMTAVGSAAKDAAIDGVLVAPMVAGGVETIIGVVRDPVFGPVVMFGLSGIYAEVVKDVSYRIAPFGLDEAHRMINEVRGRVLLDGVRGQPAADLDALAQALSQLSVYAAVYGDCIESIDINPLLVLPKGDGAIAVDALILTTRNGADNE